MISNEWKSKWGKFRRSRRAWRSLLVLLVLLVLSLPAELLCNSKPLAIRFNGRWYFPVFQRYTERDFGGTEAVEPSYLAPRFRRLVGHDAGGTPEATPVPGTPPATSILSGFDDETDTAHKPPPRTPADPVAALLARFDPEPPWERPPPVLPPSANTGAVDAFDDEPGDSTPVAAPVAPSADKPLAVRPAWILWPPVRYDYATIATGSRTGRDALAAPFERRLPGTDALVPSSWLDGHYLGTDDRGRDVLARLVYGFRVSMLFGLALAVTSTILGTLVGGIQGFFGGWLDLLGQRLTEIWGSMPKLYLLMILSSLLARNIWMLFAILNLTSWMGLAAYMRAEFLKARNFDYVRAARALGVSGWAIMWRHLLPNSLTPIVTFFPFMITGGILALVSLDFLNLGVPSPYPSLGEMLSQGQANLHATWIILPTFVLLSGTLTLLTFVGDGIRNAFDPRRQ